MLLVNLNSIKGILLLSLFLFTFSLGKTNPEKEKNTDPIYVKASASGDNDGSSWRDAYTDLQDALAAAASIDQEVDIYVAQGIYYPTAGNDRNISFEIPANVRLQGGFKGDELGQFIRGFWETYPTILSGNIGNKNAREDNSYHVLTASSLSSDFSIEGFIIRDGYANGSGEDRHGAGLYVKDVSASERPEMYSCLFTENIALSGDGGAIYIENGDMAIGFSIFLNNQSRGDGGAVCVRGGSSVLNIRTCDFIENISVEEEGGAIAAFGAELTVGRSAFLKNQGNQGGGVYTGRNTPLQIEACTFFNNQTGQGAGSAIRARGSAGIKNSIFWKNENTSSINVEGSQSITYTLAEELYPGTGNLSADPLFRNEAALDISLSPGSPAINADDSGVSDLGARQYNGNFIPALLTLRVDPKAVGLANGSSWIHAYPNLQDALERAKESAAKVEIWVAEGIYLPTKESNRSISFELSNNVSLLGGFAGHEREKEERDPKTNTTTLSGNILSSSAGDNSWHVIRADSLSDPAVLDGFTITGGYGSGSGSDRHGAGILITNSQYLQISNCTFENNRAPSGDGGAIFAPNSKDIRIQDCKFIGNIARGDGGAVNIPTSSSNFDFFSTIFEGNQSTEEDGGALAVFGQSVRTFSSLFFNNKAERGGAVYNARFGTLEIQHSTFSKNEANPGFGSAIYTRGEFKSALSIYWKNTSATPIQSDNPNGIDWEVRSSIVEGGWTYEGQGNLNLDPLFVNEVQDNFQLLAGSPAIDVNDDISFPYTDLLGNPRILNSKSDMGAYEFRGNVCGDGQRLYVDFDATGLSNGSSWSDAYTDLQEALSTARECENIQEIWVAEGTYQTSQTANNDETFRLVSGVSIYGGFSGNETDLSQRDWTVHKSILSGFIECNESNTSCSQRADVVVVGEDLEEGTIIDGLTITGGANGTYISSGFYGSDGAGMILTISSPDKECKPTISNCRFEDNDVIYGSGGGIYVNYATPIIDHCQFISNFAETDGGGLFFYGEEKVKVSNCLFRSNSCYFDGGGIASYLPMLEVENCVFYSNFAELDGGGGISTGFENDLIVRNSTFHYNRVDEGSGGALSWGGQASVYNSIFWQNGHLFVDEYFNDTGFSGLDSKISIKNSIVEFGWPGVGNLDTYPEFVDEENGDLRLRSNSVAVDGGDNAFAILSQDLEGNPRISGGTVDMGAYEFNRDCDLPTRLYVKKGSSGDGSSWSSAIPELSIALQLANECASVEEVWISADTYIAGEGAEELSLYDLDRLSPSFKIRGNLKLVGGFTGTESSFEDRSDDSYSILKENLKPNPSPFFNNKRILTASRTSTSSLIDGLSLEDASNIAFYAAGIEDSAYSLTIQNCQFKRNVTAATASLRSIEIKNSLFESNVNKSLSYVNTPEVSSISIENCRFLRNSNEFLLLKADSVAISNSLFQENQAYGILWGQVLISNSTFLNNSSPLLKSDTNNGEDYILHMSIGELMVDNSVFTGNQTLAGGVLSIRSFGKSTLSNSTFFNNPQQKSNAPGGSIVLDPYADSLFVYNSILWSNVDPSDQEGEFSYGSFFGSTTPATSSIYIAHSTVQNGWEGPGENNLDLYPEFVDTTFSSLDLSLGLGSPAIDAGSSEFVISNFDLAGLPRIIGDEVDMGAYEFDGTVCAYSERLYVDKDATGNNDGSSWENAFPDLHQALLTAKNCDEVAEIWVAEGTYKPTLEEDVSISFELVSGVALYGGFEGTETELGQRNLLLSPTILSGLLVEGPEVYNSIRSNCVVAGENLDANTMVDGFTITYAGYRYKFPGSDFQGGMTLINTDSTLFSTPTIRNCKFILNRNEDNNGGALRVLNVSPIIDNCVFENNYADNDGGAIYAKGSDELRITNSLIYGNKTLDFGGGITLIESNLEAENCIFRGNLVVLGGGGGAIYAGEGSDVTIRNSTFYSNSLEDEDGDGAALYVFGTTSVYNSIFWANGNQSFARPGDDLEPWDRDFPLEGNLDELTLSHCIYQSGWPGEGNIDEDPNFVDRNNDDFRILATSPAIDAGLTSEVTLPTDLRANARVVGGTVDIGAYEFQGFDCLPSTNIYVSASATGMNDGSSWSNAFTDLQDAIFHARNCSEVKEIWVAEGTYKPTPTFDDKISFYLSNGVSLYGGFQGNESSLSQRNWKLYPTILSGYLGMFNGLSINSRHVVVGVNVDSTALLDGFIIRDGSNYGESWCDQEGTPFCTEEVHVPGGGGLLIYSRDRKVSNPIIQNCRFEDNINKSDGRFSYNGGGLQVWSANLTIQHCEFERNYAGYRGGAISVYSFLPTGKVRILNSIFKGNVAENSGGAISLRVDDQGIEIENCVFTENIAQNGEGGGVFSGAENLVIRNSTFFRNKAGGSNTGVFSDRRLKIYNSILWSDGSGKSLIGSSLALGAFTFSHNIIEGGWQGVGENNLDLYPEFVDTTSSNLDLRLMVGSPAIDAGSSEFVISDADLDGLPRIIGEAVDIGAYEFQGITIPAVTRFMLIDADSDLPIREINSGDILNYATLGPVNIEAQTQGDVSSVKFEMEGPIRLRRTENVPPWALFGDRNGDYRASTLFPGKYTLKATPYELPAAVGESGMAKEIEFEVFGADGSIADNPFLVQLFPNPSSGRSTLSIPTDWQEDTRLRLMDKVGKVVWQSTLSSGTRIKKLEFTNLAEGVYLLQVNNGDKLETRKLIIRK